MPRCKATNARLVESTVNIANRHIFFGRLEHVEKDELFLPTSPLAEHVFFVGKLTIGYIFDFLFLKHLQVGLGLLVNVALITFELDRFYSSNPVSTIFLP